MKAPKRKRSAGGKGRVIALALTWDGARWSAQSLPVKARNFLAEKGSKVSSPNSRAMAKLFSDDQVREIRICWVPRMKGGPDVLSEPFLTATGMRIPFRSVKSAQFGDVLGVVYRRQA